jgi:cell division septum initiation protein DivIVA
LQFYENNKNGRVAESNSGPLEQKVNDEPEMMQVLKSKDQRMDRLQKHMAEMFEEAEKRAEAIIADAELQKVEIIQQGKAEAEGIISEAQRMADEIKKAAEDKIKEAKLVKYELEQRAQDVQNQIILRAQQLDEMQGSFSEMSQKLRGLVQGASA